MQPVDIMITADGWWAIRLEISRLNQRLAAYAISVTEADIVDYPPPPYGKIQVTVRCWCPDGEHALLAALTGQT